MMIHQQLYFGAVPVPYTVSWSTEKRMFIDRCPHAGRTAICQEERRGEGKPEFKNPHACRQREVIAKELCDLCARPLRLATKVSLSKARPRGNAATYGDVLQTEPLLHRECAAISMKHCPALRRDIRDGSLEIRQVFRHQVQFAVFDEEGTFELTGQRRRAIFMAKVQLLKWRPRDTAWLGVNDA